MQFNSLQFAFFFLVVFSLYVALSHKWQNRMLLVASYVFYGSWDWRFLSLIIASTILDYFCGLGIHSSTDRRRKKWLLALSVAGNLSMLGFFKYFNFFADNFQALFSTLGLDVNTWTLHVVLPVGISFYTFQTMSYTIDIYRRELEPTRKFLDFALFVAFFPQLVAGPIERAKRLLPQVLAPRTVTLARIAEGAHLVFWGLFQKVVVANGLDAVVTRAFGESGPYNGPKVLLAAYAFAFEILCDFGGYSCIARGLGKMMGFDIMTNFNLPYFATNPQDFWRRWHISLSTWLKDYLYIPLGGNRGGQWKTYRNLSITMLLGGLWHGASWTFVLWGAYHGLLLVVYRMIRPLIDRVRLPDKGWARFATTWLGVAVMFHLVCIGWIMFRSQSVGQVWAMLQGLVMDFEIRRATGVSRMFFSLVRFTFLYVLIQLLQLKKNDLMALTKLPVPVRGAVYLVMYHLILVYGVEGGEQFIYFQF